jgi:transposase
MKILKQILGVDVSQKELEVTLGRLKEDLTIELYSHRVFSNKEAGFIALEKWLYSNTDSEVSLRIVMEATGVYHQKFAYFMLERKFNVSIVLPNKISNYIRTLDVKTITDKTCSEAITRFGLERQLEDWRKPDEIFMVLKQLTRERDQIVDERTVAKNRLHAEEKEAFPNVNSIKRINALIKFFNKQEKDIKKEIHELLKENQPVKETVERICTIPGMGELTAVILLAETNGFELIRNKKQLTSYAGMDVIEKSSGTSIKGKPKLSKKGNKHIRKSLHLPSLSAVKHNPIHRDIYIRLVAKHGIKMKALVAIQRKMLELAYTLFKNKSVYDKEYKNKESCTNDELSLKLA